MHRSEPEFEEFYHEKAPELSRRWYPFYSDPEDLEEDVQDTMLAVFRQWHKMKSWSREEQVKYTEGVMKNKYADTYRERGKIKRLRNRLQFRRNHSHLIHVEESALKNEAVKALMSLPSKQRLTLGLHVLEGMSYAEIAIYLGMKSSTVRTHVNRARKTLNEQFNGEGLNGLDWEEGQA